jgi:hypothetical protein
VAPLGKIFQNSSSLKPFKPVENRLSWNVTCMVMYQDLYIFCGFFFWKFKMTVATGQSLAFDPMVKHIQKFRNYTLD